MIYLMNDIRFMKRALSLARRAQGRTSPNPSVGAVIVRDNRIISEGYHKKAGLPHAEAEAIHGSKEDLTGAVLYVTLEPCCHTDKRTPPCVNAIISSGMRRVVIAAEDPNPRVAGRGIAMLRKAGIEVTLGVLRREAELLNEAYVKFITTGSPFVTLKTAMTLDGKIATPEGKSKWITCEESRRLVHRLRGSVDAILSAIGTVRADDPRFTARARGARNPVRIIIDPDLKVPDSSHVLKTPPDTVIVTKNTGKRADALGKNGVSIIRYSGSLDLKDLMSSLGGMGICSVLIEGGSSLAAHALNDGIVDKIMYFIAPKIIGGRASYTAVGGPSSREIEDAICIRDMKVRRIGGDILIEGYIVK